MKMNDSKPQIRNPKMEIGLGLPLTLVDLTYTILCGHPTAFSADGCLVTDRRMNALSIVESFDPIDDIELRLSPGFIVGPIDAVRFSGS